MKFYDFFPGLSQSNEVWFGKQSELSIALITYAEKFIEFFNTVKPTDKKFYNDILKISTSFGNELANILNVEKCNVCISPDIEPNAAALTTVYLNECCYKYTKDGEEYTSINLDKIADLEDIIISNKNGYTFKNKKGKILYIEINYGLFKIDLTPEELAGILCHEIGHCFQEAIFGLFKSVADIAISNIVKDKQRWYSKIFWFVPFGWLRGILSYLFFPKLLSTPLFAKIGAMIQAKIFEPFKNSTYLMKEKLKKWDNGDKKIQEELNSEDDGMGVAKDIIRYDSSLYNEQTKQEYADEKAQLYEKQWKEYIKALKKKPEEENLAVKLYKFFRAIAIDIHLLDNNVADVIALNDYTVNQYAKISFYKRYEFFADAFASSYGFGPHLQIALQKMQKDYDKFMDDEYIRGINKIPFFKSMFKTQALIYQLRYSRVDVHGTQQERSRNTYTMLMQELKTNPTLTSEQKKNIQQDIELLLEADEKFYKERQESNFWFKYYNKLLDQRIQNKINEDTITEVLKPIEEAIKQQ